MTPEARQIQFANDPAFSYIKNKVDKDKDILKTQNLTLNCTMHNAWHALATVCTQYKYNWAQSTPLKKKYNGEEILKYWIYFW